MKNYPAYLIVHHAGGTDANPLQDSSGYTVQNCNADHKARFNFISTLGWYVGYQYFIDKNGRVTQCRADDEEGAHTIGFNTSSIGICLAGNFDSTIPTHEQVTSLELLMGGLIAKYQIRLENIRPHRDFAVKSCYGWRLAENWARSLMGDYYVNPPSFLRKVISDLTLWVRKLQVQADVTSYNPQSVDVPGRERACEGICSITINQ